MPEGLRRLPGKIESQEFTTFGPVVIEYGPTGWAKAGICGRGQHGEKLLPPELDAKRPNVLIYVLTNAELRIAHDRGELPSSVEHWYGFRNPSPEEFADAKQW
jgi:hypothetical protein